MIYKILAETIVVVHFSFVIFVAVGGLLLLKWRRLLWAHLAAVCWGIYVEFAGKVCPLTPLENHLRQLGGSAGYEGDFIEHYILPILYPSGLTRDVQVFLGCLVIVLNIAVYSWLYRKRRPDKNNT